MRQAQRVGNAGGVCEDELLRDGLRRIAQIEPGGLGIYCVFAAKFRGIQRGMCREKCLHFCLRNAVLPRVRAGERQAGAQRLAQQPDARTPARERVCKTLPERSAAKL